jgi:trimeric autotransporter adhesin
MTRLGMPRATTARRRHRMRFVASTAVAITVLLVAPASAAPGTTPALKTWGAANGSVNAQVMLNGVLYIGGSFTSMTSSTGSSPTTRNHLAAIDMSSGALLGWNPNATGGTVSAMTTDGTNIFVGGSFSKLGGQDRSRLGSIGTDGTIRSWSSGANNTVLALGAHGGTLYVGGLFTTLGGSSRSRLGAVSTSGGGLDGWSPAANDRVRAITFTSSDIIVAGSFTQINGSSADHIARISSGGSKLSWNYASSSEISGLVTGDDGNIYASIQGGGGRVRSWTPTGSLRWTTWFDGDANAITYFKGQVIVGGHWDYMQNGTTYLPKLAAFSPSNGAPDTSWVPHPNKQVWSLSTDGTNLGIGGIFNTVHGGVYRRVAIFH